MKKIPVLFERTFKDNHVVELTRTVHPGMEWVLNGEGVATVKWDGSCCAFFDGLFWKRFDAKPGRKIPVGAIKCCDPDPVTGHWPHWVPVNKDTAEDKWFSRAKENYLDKYGFLYDGTYEAIGRHFNGNPYGMQEDTLVRHGMDFVYPERSFDGLYNFLHDNKIEGIVFWRNGYPQCKIRRKDFGLRWPAKEG